ncbi:dTDP-4-dehydrorhamnose reductase [soil metagenome]
MTRYLVAGAAGMLGTDLMSALDGRDATGLTRAQLDVTDLEAVRAAVAGFDVVINASAYTRVDDAETDEAAARAVNAVGAQNLALAAADSGAVLVQVSTDYVFDGTATEPYPEDAPLSPVSAYGRTKAEGERLALAAHPDGTVIVRVAWLYGAHGGNFPKTMLKLAADRPQLSVVTDQVGQPTWTVDVAGHILSLLDAGVRSGVLHATNSGRASWYEFARAVFERAGLDPERVTPTDAASFVRPAPRPAFSVLGHAAWAAHGLPEPRDWREALDAAFAAGVFATP